MPPPSAAAAAEPQHRYDTVHHVVACVHVIAVSMLSSPSSHAVSAPQPPPLCASRGVDADDVVVPLWFPTEALQRRLEVAFAALDLPSLSATASDQGGPGSLAALAALTEFGVEPGTKALTPTFLIRAVGRLLSPAGQFDAPRLTLLWKTFFVQQDAFFASLAGFGVATLTDLRARVIKASSLPPIVPRPRVPPAVATGATKYPTMTNPPPAIGDPAWVDWVVGLLRDGEFDRFFPLIPDSLRTHFWNEERVREHLVKGLQPCLRIRIVSHRPHPQSASITCHLVHVFIGSSEETKRKRIVTLMTSVPRDGHIHGAECSGDIPVTEADDPPGFPFDRSKPRPQDPAWLDWVVGLLQEGQFDKFFSLIPDSLRTHFWNEERVREYLFKGLQPCLRIRIVSHQPHPQSASITCHLLHVFTGNAEDTKRKREVTLMTSVSPDGCIHGVECSGDIPVTEADSLAFWPVAASGAGGEEGRHHLHLQIVCDLSRASFHQEKWVARFADGQDAMVAWPLPPSGFHAQHVLRYRVTCRRPLPPSPPGVTNAASSPTVTSHDATIVELATPAGVVGSTRVWCIRAEGPCEVHIETLYVNLPRMIVAAPNGRSVAPGRLLFPSQPRPPPFSEASVWEPYFGIDDPLFVAWMKEGNLLSFDRTNESTLQFATRTVAHLVRTITYDLSPATCDAFCRAPFSTVTALQHGRRTHCTGYCNLFIGAMRLHGVPAVHARYWQHSRVELYIDDANGWVGVEPQLPPPACFVDADASSSPTPPTAYSVYQIVRLGRLPGLDVRAALQLPPAGSVSRGLVDLGGMCYRPYVEMLHGPYPTSYPLWLQADLMATNEADRAPRPCAEDRLLAQYANASHARASA